MEKARGSAIDDFAVGHRAKGQQTATVFNNFFQRLNVRAMIALTPKARH